MLVAPLALALTLPLAAPEAVTFDATDGGKVRADWYEAGDDTRPVVLLMHQAGSSRGEYATIAPRLNAMGLSALAIDQRSGGGLFGTNETAARHRKKQPYLAARADIEGALTWIATRAPKRKVVLWGSSYSAALAFLVAADHPEVAAVLSFSPGEYIKDAKGARVSVGAAAKKLRRPALILTPAKEDKRARPIAEAIAGAVYQTPPGAVHGSSMLIAKRCAAAPKIWPTVEAFLVEHAGATAPEPKPDARAKAASPSPRKGRR